MRAPPGPLRPPIVSKSVCYTQDYIQKAAEEESLSTPIIDDDYESRPVPEAFDVAILIGTFCCGAIGIIVLLWSVLH